MPQIETGQYRGFDRVQITTSGHLFNPVELFSLVDDMNRAKGSNRVGIELYPTNSPRWLESIGEAARKQGLQLPIAPRITAGTVRNWQQDYPNANIERVHIEFWTTWGERLKRFYEVHPKKWPHFIGSGLAFSPASELHGINLARELGVGVNIHGNVIVGLKSLGKVPVRDGGIKYVLAENGLASTTPFNNSIRRLFDPFTVVNRLISANGMDGLLLGADHLRDLNLDPSMYLAPEILECLRVVHIAEKNHGEVRRGNPVYERFIRNLARSKHPHEVALALDNNPFSMGKMTYDEKLDYYTDTINWLWEIQNDELARAAVRECA